MEKMEITADAIQKAKELLGIVKAEVTTTPTEDLTKAKDSKKDEIEKLKAECDGMLAKAKEFSDKAEAIKAQIVKMADNPNGDDSGNMKVVDGGVEKDFINKAAQEELIKAATEDLKKGFDEKFSATNLLIQAKEQENDILKKSLETLTANISDLTGKVDKIGQTSQGPRSIISKGFAERFEAPKEGEKTLSISRDKKEVSNMLLKAANGDYSPSNIFSKAASTLEFAGAIGGTPQEANEVAMRLRNLEKVVLVP